MASRPLGFHFRDGADHASYEATLLSLQQRAIATLAAEGARARPVPEGFTRALTDPEIRVTFQGSDLELGDWIRTAMPKLIKDARTNFPRDSDTLVCASIDLPTSGMYIDWQNLVCHVILWPAGRGKNAGTKTS